MSKEKKKGKDAIEVVWGEAWKTIKEQFKLTPRQFEANFIGKGVMSKGKREKETKTPTFPKSPKTVINRSSMPALEREKITENGDFADVVTKEE